MLFDVEEDVTGRGPYKPRRALKEPRTFGERLQVLRRAVGLNQAALAKAIGVPQQSISSWERGITEPSGPGMLMLTRFLGVTAAALKTGKGFTTPEARPVPEDRVTQPSRPGGGYVAVEDGAHKPIALPTAIPGTVWGVDVASGEQVTLTKEQAMAWLSEAFDEDEPMWILVKPLGKTQARTSKKGTPKKV